MGSPTRNPSSGPPRLKSHELDEFKTFNDIMHLMHHRNLNQHRQSIWWRHFSTFRREMLHFAAEYDAINASKTAAKKTSKRVVARVENWKNSMLPKWYLAFTAVIASTQFSAIGLALMAILARVSHCLGITAAYEAEAEREMQTVLEEFAAKDTHELFEPPRIIGNAEDVGEVITRRAGDTDKVGDDLGEVVTRQEVYEAAGMEPDPEPELVQRPKTKVKGQTLEKKNAKGQATKRDIDLQPKACINSNTKPRWRNLEDAAEADTKEPPKKKKKMKKGKGGSIDDLFAGL